MFQRTVIRAGFAVALLASALQVHAASLTIFHNNDGESKLLGDANFGGAAYFTATLDALRVANSSRDQLTLSSGDNFLAGASFNASLASGSIGSRTYFDALALSEIGYDAITLGNHDFDYGPEVLADFINFYNNNGGSAPFLSSNLDFSGEASLQGLVDSGSIAKSTIITRGTETYGIIGATTETLNIVSNPGAVGIGNVLAAVQAQVDALENQGVNKIILSSHLQSITNEIDLIGQLRGVDVVIAGGGDELLLNADNARNSATQAEGAYPLTVQDADGKNVAVVTTVGEYLYVGKLDVEFDANGDVVNVGGEPVVVNKNTVTPDADVVNNVINPLNAATAIANATVIASTEVFLEHSEGNTNGPRVIRTRETNLGNLIADAFVWAVRNEGTGLTDGNTLIGLTNSGGIREDLDNDQNGLITQGEAQATLPFTNTMAVIRNVDISRLVAALENAVSAVPTQNGRFAQISGFSFDFNPEDAAGERVRRVRLADGTLVWDSRSGSSYSGLFDIATNSFLAGEGTPDGYDFSGLDKAILSTLYADALIGFLDQGLDGIVTAQAYGLAGDNRINEVPVPAALWMFLSALGLLGLGTRNRI